MIGKKDQSVLTGILYSLFFGSFFGFFVYRHWPQSHPVLGYFVAAVPFVICYFVECGLSFVKLNSTGKFQPPAMNFAGDVSDSTIG